MAAKHHVVFLSVLEHTAVRQVAHEERHALAVVEAGGLWRLGLEQRGQASPIAGIEVFDLGLDHTPVRGAMMTSSLEGVTV